MINYLTVVRQQVLRCISSFHSSWLFLLWNVAWQNHRHPIFAAELVKLELMAKSLRTQNIRLQVFYDKVTKNK